VDGTVLYTYRVEAKEAGLESDYEAIVELEQHHYAAEDQPHIRREIFPAEWYEPPFQPERLIEELRKKNFGGGPKGKRFWFATRGRRD